MADFFRRLSEQVFNRAAVVQPLRVSRFALMPEIHLPTPTQLRQRLSAPVHYGEASAAAPAFAPGRLPEALVPPEAPYNTWRIPSLRQLGRTAGDTGSVINPQRNPSNMSLDDSTTFNNEFAETVQDAPSSASVNQIASAHRLSPLVGPMVTTVETSESGNVALVDPTLAIRNQNAPSAESAIPPITGPQHSNANVGLGRPSLDTALAGAAASETVAFVAPAPSTPGGALPRVAPDRRSGAQLNSILQETGVVPILPPERALEQPRMAESTSAPLLSEGDVAAGSAAANNLAMAPANQLGTSQLAAIQSPSIAVATDSSRPAALDVTPVLPTHDTRLAVPAEAGNVASAAPAPVSPGGTLPRVAPDRRSGAQINSIPQETGVVPILPPERALEQPRMAESTSAPLLSEGDVSAGAAAANNRSMAPTTLPGTPQFAAIQSPPITVAPDPSRPVELQVSPVLTEPDNAPAPTFVREKPSVTIEAAEKLSRAVDRQPAAAPAPLVAGIPAEPAPTNRILPAPTPPAVASPNTATDRSDPPGKMLPAAESQLIPMPQARSENLHEVSAAFVSAPSNGGRRESANVEAIGNASAAALLVAPLFPVAEDRGNRHQGETTPMPLVNQGNLEPMRTVNVAPQLVPVQVQPEEVRPPTAENRGERAQRETTAAPAIQENIEPMRTVSARPQLDSAWVRPEEVRPPAAERFRPAEIAAAVSQPIASSTQAYSEAKHPVPAARDEPTHTLEAARSVSSVNEAAIQRDAVNALSPLVQPNFVDGSLTPALSSPSASLATAVAQPARSGGMQAEVGRRRPVEQVLGMPTDEVGQPSVSPNLREAGIADTVLLQPRASVLAQQLPMRQQVQPPAEITVRVTIGRVEVQQTAEPLPPSPRRRTTQPVLSLDAYLARTHRGQA